MILTEAQAMQYALAAGFTGQSADIIVAIAHAESSFNTLVTNTAGNIHGTDRGIMQINSYYHPEVTNACAFDPACSFRAAFVISRNGTNFTPWTTYTKGVYKRYLPSGVPSSGTTNLPNIPAIPIPNPIGSIQNTLAWINPLRIAKLLLGIGLIGVALLGIFFGMSPTQMVTKAAKALP